jgi:hypothetical protein
VHKSVIAALLVSQHPMGTRPAEQTPNNACYHNSLGYTCFNILSLSHEEPTTWHTGRHRTYTRLLRREQRSYLRKQRDPSLILRVSQREKRCTLRLYTYACMYLYHQNCCSETRSVAWAPIMVTYRTAPSSYASISSYQSYHTAERTLRSIYHIASAALEPGLALF